MRFIKAITELFSNSKGRSRRQKVLAALMAIVVFCTTYALILPAITLDSRTAETEPGIEAEQAAGETLGPVQDESHLSAGEAADVAQTEEGKTETDFPETAAPAWTEADTEAAAKTETATGRKTDSETAAGAAAETAGQTESTKATEPDTEKDTDTETQTEEIYAESPLLWKSSAFDVEIRFDSEDWQLPEGTTLTVKELKKDTDTWNYYDARARKELKALDKNTEKKAETVSFYELTLSSKGKEIAMPKGAADLTISYHLDKDSVYKKARIIGDEEELLTSLFWHAKEDTILFDKNWDNSPVTSLTDHRISKIKIKDLALADFENVIGLFACPKTEAETETELKMPESAVTETEEAETKAAETEAETEAVGKKAIDENGEKAVSNTEIESALETETEAKTAAKTFTLTAVGTDYTVTVNCGEQSGVPEGALLKVSEIKSGTGAFDEYLETARETIGQTEASAVPAEYARFFDITILADGQPVEPAGDVDVKISFHQPVSIEQMQDVSAVHFGENGAEQIEASAQQSEQGVENVTFAADSFSVYGVVYTVDFEYEINGQTYQFSLAGGEKIALSELAEALGIIGGTNYENTEAFLAEVKDVTFSDESLVKVSKNLFGKDWTLKSLQAFSTEETLAITMKDDSVIEVKVTDAQDTTSPWNLANEDNTQFLHVSVASSVTQTEQERDAVFKLHFTYSLEEDVVRAIDNYEGNPVLVYDLSSLIENSPLDIQNSVMDISIGSRKLGTCTFRDGVAYLEFTDPTYFDGRTSFTGFFDLTAQTNETELGSHDEWTYTFPGTSDTVTVHYKKTVEEGSKTVYATQDADGNYTLHYTADINVNTDLDSMTFKDVISGLQTLDASSVKINGNALSVTPTNNGFTFNVASALGTTGVAKGSYRVTYDTKVTKAQLEAMTADKTTETNRADWTVNGTREVPGGQTTYEINKPVPPIPVEKTQSSSGTNQPGDMITYTVTYGDANTSLANFHISDTITDVVIPQGSSVTLHYGNGQSVQVPFGAQAADNTYSKGTVTLYDYTFPSGTTGTGPVTVTYSVRIIDAQTAKANGVYDTTQINNIAVEHRQNTSDKETTTVTYEKEPTYTVDKTASVSPASADGSWQPGSTITYTLTIGDANTNMAGVNIRDVMTDLQTLQGDIMIRVGNGSQMKLSDYVSGAIKWSDDGNYSTNDVELFNFNMPSNAGNGPVVITYQTKVISQDQAAANNIYGDVNIRNTGYGGKQSDGTSGTGPFNPYPIGKTVSQNGTDINGHTAAMGSTVHYSMTFGDASMNLSNVTISDEMTDLQKLVGNVTVTKADGTSFTMPMGSGQWATDGVVWNYFDDGKYSTGNVRVFYYQLPADIGNGPITVEYDAQIISEEEANENGIKDTQHVNNTFRVGNHQAQTTVDVDYPVDQKHEAQVRKEFDHWDVDGGRVYWNIIVEKDADSAYPLENVSVREATDQSHVVFKSESQGVWYYAAKASDFDVIHAIVTTDDGTELTPGVDYSIDKENALFHFPVLNERVHINLAFQTDVKIVDGTWMKNEVRLDNGKTAEAEATYNTPEINTIKYGTYDESNRLVKWQVILNPAKKSFEDSNPVRVWFEDTIPEGLTLVNYSSKTVENPSIYVSYEGDAFSGKSSELNVIVDGSDNKITKTDIAAHNPWDPNSNQHFGLDREKIVVTYYTLLSDEEWKRITSSGSGSATYENKVTVTAGDGEEFTAKDSVTVTSDEYLTKYDTTQETNNGVVIDSNGNTSKKITYKIEINPHGYTLNNRNPLTLTDYISTNMDLDTSSVKLYTATMGSDGKLIPGTEQSTSNIVSYNDDSRLLALREIPDASPMILEYVCIARAQGEDTFTNTATLIGGGSHSSSTSEKHNVQTNDAGVKVDGITMSLHKIDENDISKDLANAKFQLYECRLQIGDLTNPDTFNQAYWDALLDKVNRRTAGTATEAEIAEINEQFAIVEYVPIGEPVSTGTSGFTQWTSLNEHKLYAWREVEAPENYTGSGEYHYFVGYQHINVNSDELPQPLLPEAEQLDRKHAAWALDDACQFANGIKVASMANLTTWTATNIHTPYTSVAVNKVWSGDSDNLFDTRPKEGIRLQLYRIDYEGNAEPYGTPVAINVDDNGDWPGYIWNRLLLYETDPETGDADESKPYTYTVVEERVDGYTTTYRLDGDAAAVIDGTHGTNSGTIIVTNKMIPKNTNIYVRKVFEGIDEGTPLPSQIHVTLMKIRTDKEGNSSDPIEEREAMLTESGNWEYAFEKLDTTEVVDGVAYTLTYTVVEDTQALKQEGFDYTVTYSDNGQGVIEAPADDPLVITNRERVGTVKVTKAFAGIEAAEYPSGFQILASWMQGEEATSKALTLMDEQPENVTRTGSGTSEDPYEWTISDIPIGTEVTFAESGYDVSGYEVTVTGSAAAEDKTTATAIADEEPGTASFVNTYTPLTFEVTKIWKDTTDENVDWVKDLELTLHKKANGTEQTFAYSVKQVTVDGVSTITATSTDTGAPAVSVSGNKDDGYTIRFTGLESGYEYYATETKVEDYQDPVYAFKDSRGVIQDKTGDNAGYAADEEYIINRPVNSYELPSTGGPGTKLFTIMGSALILAAGVLLLRRRRTLKGGGGLL